MKHNFRQRVINEYGLPVVKVESVNCELGSGVLDKNGVEIFEGDIVKNIIPPGYVQDDNLYIVYFCKGSFLLIEEQDWDCREHCGATPLGWNSSASLEVVGHIAEEQP